MSWDFSLSVGTATACECDENYTYNVAPMFYEAFRGTEFEGLGIRGLDEQPAPKCLAALEAAIADMEANPEKYSAMNPPNGWGDSDGALRLLKTLATWCRNHPDGELSVS